MLRFMGTVKRFFKKLFRKRKGEEGVNEIPVMSFSALTSAGSDDDDDKTEPQPVVPAPVRSSCETDFCAGESSFPGAPTPVLGVTVMAGGHTIFGDPGKMARVVAWLNDSAEENSSEDGAERATPADDDNKEESDLQLSGSDSVSSLPWPPSALSDDDDEQPATPLKVTEACCLMADVEEASHGRLFSLNGVRRVLGICPRAPRGSSSNRRVTRRWGGMSGNNKKVDDEMEVGGEE